MLVSILIFIIVLSILVLVHEFGHFLAARRANIWVEEFGFGIPPRVWGKKIGETLYSLNLLPFGGFVKLHGENLEEAVQNPERAFINKDKKTRILIVVAGVFMNFILAILAFSFVYSFSGIPRETGKVKIVEVMEGSPAKESGLKRDDLIRKVNALPVTTNEEFIKIIEGLKGKEVILEVERQDGVYEIKAIPRENPPPQEGALGVIITSSEIYYPPFWQRPFWGVYFGFKEAIFWGKVVVEGLYKTIYGLFAGIVPKDIAGPVGIFAMTQEISKFGILALVNFIGILSVNLAILNIIPFPALDGGRLFFIIIESIFGKKVIPKVEAAIHTVGLVILILLAFIVTFYDIQRLILSGGITGYLESVMK